MLDEVSEVYGVEEYTFKQRWMRAESRIFDPDIGECNMQDVYWSADDCRGESSTIDFTHEIPNANAPRKRLDHILVSPEFNVQRCEIWNGVGGSTNALGVSDHAPVVAEELPADL